MTMRLPLRFLIAGGTKQIGVETIAYDGGDNNLTLTTIEPDRGLHLRSGFDYEEGRATIAVADNWRQRGRRGQPEFRLLEDALSVDAEALRRSCLYDHVARFVDFAALAGTALAVDGVDRAAIEINPSVRRSPAI
jgi:hypothetical protein